MFGVEKRKFFNTFFIVLYLKPAEWLLFKKSNKKIRRLATGTKSHVVPAAAHTPKGRGIYTENYVETILRPPRVFFLFFFL